MHAVHMCLYMHVHVHVCAELYRGHEESSNKCWKKLEKCLVEVNGT